MAHRLCNSALCNTNGSTGAVSNFVGNVSTAAAGNAFPGSCRSQPQYGNAILSMGGSVACDMFNGNAVKLDTRFSVCMYVLEPPSLDNF